MTSIARTTKVTGSSERLAITPDVDAIDDGTAESGPTTFLASPGSAVAVREPKHLVATIRFGRDRRSTCTACELVITGRTDEDMARAWSDHVLAATGRRPAFSAHPLKVDGQTSPGWKTPIPTFLEESA